MESSLENEADSESSDGEFSTMKLPSLVDQLNRLLEQYSDGQILKELIQNAEDGGASKVKIMYVNRHHQTKTPLKTWKNNAVNFAMKGPALCVYNDGVFTETDWKSIAAIQCSAKENEPLKVGRFGLGFKSVFHITDTPMIISGNTMMIMNPTAPLNTVVLKRKLSKVSKAHQDDILNLMSGIFDFCADVFKKGYYNGSIFWFPLRTEPTKMSKVIYDESKITDIFYSFQSLAPSLLLFLKGIELIELYEQKSDSKSKLILHVHMESIDKSSMREQRNPFLRKIEKYQGKLAPSSISNKMKVRVLCEGFDWLKREPTIEEWLVINHYHGGEISERMKTILLDEEWFYSPYVSVAVCLSTVKVCGHVFCFLPLPMEGKSLTGLPVHVNGFFALSQDRHHVKWYSSEQNDRNNRAEKAVLWNQCLVQVLLPEVYTEAILHLIENNVFSYDKIYQLLPNMSMVTDNWNGLAESTYRLLFSQKCMYSTNRKGTWVEPTDALFINTEDGQLDESVKSTIEHIYVLCGKNIVKVDRHIISMFLNHGDLSFHSIEYLREEMLQKNIDKHLEIHHRHCLLKYILESDIMHLQDMELLPLADGSFSTFDRKVKRHIFLCAEDEDIAMFPNLESQFVQRGVVLGSNVHELIQEKCVDKYQIKVFEPKHLSALLRQCIKETQWEKNWLDRVWEYIRKNKDSIIDLGSLCLLPRLDTKSNSKVLEKVNQNGIMYSYVGLSSLDSDISSALEKLKIKVYKDLPGCIVDVIAGTTLEYPTEEGIANCLKKLNKEECLMRDGIECFNNDSTQVEKDKLVQLLSKNNDITHVKSLIRKLQLLLPLDGNQFKSLDEVNLVCAKRDGEKLPIKYVQPILVFNDDETKTLAARCGATLVSFHKLIEDILRHLNESYCEDDRSSFLQFFLANMKMVEDKSCIIELAQKVLRVQDEDKKLRKPSDLINPNIELKDLFFDDQFMFPSIKYEHQLENLKILGLREENEITEEEILRTASKIDESYRNHGPSEALWIKGLAVLAFLKKYGETLNKQMLVNLSTLYVCPIRRSRPKGYPRNLEFDGETKGFILEKPKQLYDVENINLIGGKRHFCPDETPTCLLKFQKEVTMNDVIEQLLYVSGNYCADEEIKFIGILKDIYEFLKDCNESEVRARLSEKTVLWTGHANIFQNANYFWINENNETDIDLKPYMFPIPQIFKEYGHFFENIGCASSQRPELLLRTLHLIDEKNKMQGTKTTQKDRSLVLQILNTLAYLPDDFSERVLLPVVTDSDDVLKLLPASQCTVFDDDVFNYFTPIEDEDEFFVHPCISFETAKKFKVKSVRERVLANADSFDMNFGQTEPLTTRLSNLLKEYTEGFSIPKEIIQNADDAGATVVKLLYDERTVPEAQTCLYNEGMKSCQGPAFWAFNNARFTNDDIQNITKLAGETKKDDSTKIGRFGLGFNSVYNITDVPSFVSGDSYIVFDPNSSHLGTSGIKMKLNNPKCRLLRETIKGHFYPFEGIFGCEIIDKQNVNFEGSLFRLPLRNAAGAAKSKIKNLAFSRSEMEELIKKIEEGAGIVLLFTQNVKSVELYHLEAGAKPKHLKLLMKVDKSSDTSSKGSILQYLTSLPVDKRKVRERVEIKLSITKHSENVCSVRKQKSVRAFDIFWCWGRGRSLDVVKRQELQGLLPVSATAFSKTAPNDIGFFNESHIFCFLPLPITTSLPVHLNAPFSVQSNRRNLAWKNEDDIKEYVDDMWNTALLQDACTHAYIFMLCQLSDSLSMAEYYDMWPSPGRQNKLERIISNEIYLTLCKEDHDVLLGKEGKRVCLNQATFLHPELRENSDLGDIALEALGHFLNDGTTVVDLPKCIFNNFINAGCADKIKTRTITTVQFYRQVLFPNITDKYWNKRELDELLIHGLYLNHVEVNKLLCVTDCIPTKPNGLRKRPCQLIDPTSMSATLFSEDEECFPENQKLKHAQFDSKMSLKLLEVLGMKTTDIEWEKLPARLTTVLLTKDPVVILQRCKKFLTYMIDRDRYKDCPEQTRLLISEIGFLPLLSSCEDENKKFISPNNGYHLELQHLVGEIKPIVDVNIVTDSYLTLRSKITAVLEWLGVKCSYSDVDCNLVISNMLKISDKFISADKTGKEGFEKLFTKMYDFLRDVISRKKDMNLSGIKPKLTNKRVILHKGTLKTPEEMIIMMPTDLSPYYFEVEHTYNKYTEFFTSIGVKYGLLVSMILDTLIRFSEDKQAETRLKETDLTLLRNMCNELLRVNDGQKLSDDRLTSIKLPDKDCVLTPSSNLFFSDNGWLEDVLDSEVKLLHKSIPVEAAEIFGVKSKRQHHIGNISTNKFSEFEQHEDLTRRIKNILRGYPRDDSILKEIIQNADDAKATEVIFIKDFRKLGTERIPAPGMKIVQGPSFCIYNDSFFSEMDLKGIQALGEGSKGDDVLKTGQYGVGFNVVYQVTDVPSFWTKGGTLGEMICVFDPHRKHLDISTIKSAGVKIPVAKLAVYSDFLDGYLNTFTSKLNEGTLFRLPLRDKNAAENSEISDNETTADHVNKILENFKSQIFSCMMFLKNVTKIKIGTITDDGDLVIEHEMVSEMSPADHEKKKQYNEHLICLYKSIDTYIASEYETSHHITLKDKKRNEAYLVVNRVGSFTDPTFPQDVLTAYRKGKFKKLPIGGIAINLSWKKIIGLAYCMLPLPIETGFPLHVNGQFALDHECRRNLLQEKNSVEASWNTYLANSVIIPAYITALKMIREFDINSTLYESLFPLISEGKDVFWKNLSIELYKRIARDNVPLFPLKLNQPTQWPNLQWKSLQIGRSGKFAGCFNTLADYFKKDGHVTAGYPYRSQQVFHGIAMRNSPKQEDEIMKCLLNLGLQILSSSKIILDQFKHADVEVQIVDPPNVLRFLKSYDSSDEERCQITDLPTPVSSTGFENAETLKLIFDFVMRDIQNDEEINNLYGAPLLLRQDGFLDVFLPEGDIYCSKFAFLFENEASRFLSLTLVPILEDFIENFDPLEKFDIESFASMLKKSEKFRGVTDGRIVEWDRQNVTEEWLCNVWKYIHENADENEYTDIKRIMRDFCFLPVQTHERQKLLYPLSLSGHIVDLYSGENNIDNRNLKSALRKLSIPHIISICPEVYIHSLSKLIVKLDDPSALLNLLCLHKHNFQNLQKAVCQHVWTYFNTKLKDMNNIKKIASLPIFEGIDGSFVSLTDKLRYVILHDGRERFPFNGILGMSSAIGVCLLKYHGDLCNVLKVLSLENIDILTFYLQYVLKHFDLLTIEDKQSHIDFFHKVLWREVPRGKTDELKTILMTVKFIPYSGRCLKASAFYDDQNEVFKAMGHHLYFLPKPYNGFMWQKFLILAGLNIHVSKSMFIEFSKVVEQNSKREISDEVLRQSEILMENLPSQFLSDEDFCNEIKNIKFVRRYTLPKSDFRQSLFPQFGQDSMICFNGTATSENFDYVWTVRNVFEKKFFANGGASMNGYQFKNLGIVIDIDVDDFMLHFKNICHRLNKDTDLNAFDSEELCKLFDKFYSFMVKHNLSTSQMAQNPLIFIPNVGVVKPQYIIIDPYPGQLIDSYIYKCPPRYGMYETFFEKCGASKNAIPDIYLRILKEINLKCKGNPIHPNESIVIARCIDNLNQLWKKTEQKSEPSNEEHMFLPDNDGIMTKSSELVMVDNEHYFQRMSNISLKYFLGLTTLNLEEIFYYGHWPDKFKMKKLSQEINIEIKPECLQNASMGNRARDIKSKLVHPCLLEAISRLVNHKKEVTDESEEMREKQLKSITDIEIYEVDELLTLLVYQGAVVPGSEWKTYVFFIKTENEDTLSFSLYIDKSIGRNSIHTSKKLSSIFQRIFHVDINEHFRDVWQLMVDDKADEVKAFLDSEGIGTTHMSFGDFAPFPPPGTIIPESLHWLLDNSFTEFVPGEYVGYEIYDPEIDPVKNDCDSPVYVYAKIVKINTSQTSINQRIYELDVGEERSIFSSATKIYKFYRPENENLQELVPYQGKKSNEPRTNKSTSATEDINMDEVLKNIRELLTQTWKTCDEKERKRVVKRLLLQWHPDKNINNVTKATKITQKIFQYVEMLDKGQPLEKEMESEEFTSHSSAHSNYNDFYENMRSRGSNYARQSREDHSFYRGSRRNNNYRRRNYSYHRHAQYTPNPMPGQARRWLRQAEKDLEAAEQSLHGGVDAHNWTCYQCHQSAEKALKAVWFNIDANKVTDSHDLNIICSNLPNPRWRELASDLHETIGHQDRMRYPSTFGYPDIPFDMYSVEDSKKACGITRSIVRLAHEMIHE